MNYQVAGANSAVLGIGSGGITANGGATITLLSSLPIQLFADQTWQATNATSLLAQGVISGAFKITKTGNFDLPLSAANTFSGGFSLNDGELYLGTSSIGTAGSVTSGPVGTGTLSFDANRILGVTGASTILHNDISLGSNNPTFATGANSLTLAGTISGTGSITKTGSGSLTLSGANTFSGETNVQAGTLVLGSSSNKTSTITDGPVGTYELNLSSGTTLAIADGTTRILHNDLHFVGTGTVTFNTATGDLTLASFVHPYGGGDSASLTKTGSGSLTLTNPSNSYTGGTIINAGTIIAGSDPVFGQTTGGITFSGGLLKASAGFTSARAVTLNAGGGLTDTNPYSLTLSGLISGSGGLTKQGTGTFTVSGAGSNIVNLTGTVGGSVLTSIGSGAILLIGSGGTITGPITTSGTLNFTNPGSQNLSGVISGAGGLNISAGTTTLSGNNTFSGSTTVAGGKLLVTGPNTGGGSVTIGSGGVFGGSGSFSGPVFVNSDGSVSPGNSPGALSVGATTFAGGGSFAFEINSVTGTPGTPWDLLSVSGALNIAATVGAPFIINLTSLTLSNTAGLVSDFNNANSYAWKFVQTSGGVTGFSAGAFQYNATNFQNSLGGGSFFVSNLGNDLFLNFKPVPEPSTYALMALGLGGIVLLARRRRS